MRPYQHFGNGFSVKFIKPEFAGCHEPNFLFLTGRRRKERERHEWVVIIL
jgi:hypothetical protein